LDIISALTQNLSNLASCLKGDDDELKRKFAFTFPSIVRREDEECLFIQHNGIDVILHLLQDPVYFEQAALLLYEFMKSKQPNEDFSPPTLVQTSEFMSVFNDPDVSDVKFIVEEHVVYSSRAILAARSDYFRTMLAGVMRESRQTEIIMKEVMYGTFVKVMEFLYTYHTKIDSTDECVKLLWTADKYQLDTLKVYCERWLKQEIGPETMIEIYDYATEFNANTLKQFCSAWFLKNLSDLMGNNEGKELIQKIISTKGFITSLTRYISEAIEQSNK